MNIKKIILFCTFVSIIALSNVVTASGSVYGGGSNFNSSSNFPRPVNQRYEHGKSLIKGSKSPYKGMKLCIDTKTEENNLQKFKAKYLKTYKEGKAQALARDIVVCSDSRKLLDVMERNDAVSVLYYLNKRYKLKLQ